MNTRGLGWGTSLTKGNHGGAPDYERGSANHGLHGMDPLNTSITCFNSAYLPSAVSCTEEVNLANLDEVGPGAPAESR